VRGVALTDAGERLVRYATKVEDLLTSAFDDVSAAPFRGGLLHLGASTTSAVHLLPKLIASFIRGVGPIAVRIEEGNSEDVLKKLEAGIIPLGVVEGPSRVPRVYGLSWTTSSSQSWPPPRRGNCATCDALRI
jgi:DNA-binding transcriptional LysR family regulator